MPGTTLDTPPSSDVELAAQLPPSPPLSPTKKSRSARSPLTAVDRLSGIIRLHREGTLDRGSDWQTLRLSETEYNRFRERLRQDPALLTWFEEKLRHDWEAAAGRLVLRMPSALHECFIARVEDAVDQQIKQLARQLEESGDGNGAKIAAELRKIYRGRSATLELKVPTLENSSQDSEEGGAKVVRRSPDATFYHPSRPDYPPLVLEVSYSQQKKDLPRLAESYIIDSSHAIRAVVGLKLPYTQASTSKRKDVDRSATYSIWRPCIESADELVGEDAVGSSSQDVTDELFSTPSGASCEGALQLRLVDLLPQHLPSLDTIPPWNLDRTISIPYTELRSFLAEAEAAQNPPERVKRQTTQQQATAPKRFRKRKRTPSEELSEGREEVYAKHEVKEREKDARVDGEYIETVRRSRRRKVEPSEQRETAALAGADDAAAE